MSKNPPYYYEIEDNDILDANGDLIGFEKEINIYDRRIGDESLAVALNRDSAQKIVDALNAKENQ